MFFWNNKKVQVVVDETQLQEAGLELKVNPLALIYTYHECFERHNQITNDPHSSYNRHDERRILYHCISGIEKVFNNTTVLQSKEAQIAGVAWHESVLEEKRKQEDITELKRLVSKYGCPEECKGKEPAEKQQLKNLIAKYGIPTEVIAGG